MHRDRQSRRAQRAPQCGNTGASSLLRPKGLSTTHRSWQRPRNDGTQQVLTPQRHARKSMSRDWAAGGGAPTAGSEDHGASTAVIQTWGPKATPTTGTPARTERGHARTLGVARFAFHNGERPTASDMARISPSLRQAWPKSGQTRPTSGQICLLFNLAELGRIRANFGRVWPRLVEIAPNMASSGQLAPPPGQRWSKVVNSEPSLVSLIGFGRHPVYPGTNLTDSAPTQVGNGRFRHKQGRHRPKSGQCLAHWQALLEFARKAGEYGPNSAKLDRSGPKFGRSRQHFGKFDNCGPMWENIGCIG